MSFQTKLSVARNVIGIASDLGLPVDVFDGLIGPESRTNRKIAELREDIRELQSSVDKGFFDALQFAAATRIQQAILASESAARSLNNVGASDTAKVTALTNASRGLSDAASEVMSILRSPSIELTPRLIDEMFTALAFSLSVQVNAAAELLYGEKLNGIYYHGGFQAVASEIQAGIDALSALQPAIDAHFKFDGYVDETVTQSHPYYAFNSPHGFDTPTEAQNFYVSVLRQVLEPEDQNFDPQFLQVYEAYIVYNFPQIITEANFQAEYAKTQAYGTEISLALSDYAFHFLTGLKVAPEPQQTGFYSWNQAEQNVFDALILDAKETVRGRTQVHDGEDSVALSTATGKDYLRGGVGNDTLTGNSGDEYIQGAGGNDLMLGVAGNDRYFGGPGSDYIIDTGPTTEVDVAVFEGSIREYTFYDDTGTTGPRIIIARENVSDVDVVRGIEFLKFDDAEIAFTELTLAPRDLTAPDAPRIVGISEDTGRSADDGLTADGTLVIRGTAEPLSFVTVSMDGPSIGQTQTDADGAWRFDYGATTRLHDGSFTFTAFATDAVNNSSESSLDFLVTIDATSAKTATFINGNGFDNTLLGTSRHDVMNGFGGNDKLLGRGGDDSLFGKAGRDDLRAGGGDDELVGGGGNDKLAGGGGDDAIFGQRGNDKLKGGGGGDDFHFKRGDGRDVILDWNDRQDEIHIDKGVNAFRKLDIYQKGKHAFVDYGKNGDVIKLRKTDADDLDAGDFVF